MVNDIDDYEGNLIHMFYLTYPLSRISELLIRKFPLDDLARAFPLSWTHYAMEGLPNKVLAAEYRTVLPAADRLTAELTKARLALEARMKDVREDRE
jgi:hypothetical protein